MNADFRYYPVTPAQKEWGLYVTCVGHNTTRPGVVFPSPEHPDEYYFSWKVGRTLQEWQLILLEAGQGEVEFKSGLVKVGVGTMIVLPPGCWHRYRPDPNTGWTTYWIGFNGDLASRLIGQAGFSKDGETRSYANAGPVLRLFAETVAGLLANAERTPFSAAARIPMLIATLLETPVGPEEDGRSASPIIKAQMYITDHLTETTDFFELARAVGLSYRSFRYLFKKESGMSPLQYQNERRLARAKNLLTSSDMPVKDIAETLGFHSTWYFVHFFQKHMKCSPAVHRKRNRPSLNSWEKRVRAECRQLKRRM